jgi:hypothetical protein
MSKKRLRREKARLKSLHEGGIAVSEQTEIEERPAEHAVHHPHQHIHHKEPVEEKKGDHPAFVYFLDKHYKKFLIVTVTILILALAQIAYQTATTGDFIKKGVSLKGGITVTVPGMEYDTNSLE